MQKKAGVESRAWKGCSGRPVASPMYQRKRVFSAVASSAPSFQQVSSKICSFCSCVILDGICRVADELGVEEAGGGWFLREMVIGVKKVMAN